MSNRDAFSFAGLATSLPHINGSNQRSLASAYSSIALSTSTKSNTRSSSLEPIGKALDDRIAHLEVYGTSVHGRNRKRQRSTVSHRPVGHGRRRRNSYSESRSCSPVPIPSTNASAGASTAVYGQTNTSIGHSSSDRYRSVRGVRRHSMTLESSPASIVSASITPRLAVPVVQARIKLLGDMMDTSPSHRESAPKRSCTPPQRQGVSSREEGAQVNYVDSSIRTPNPDPITRLKRPQLIRYSPY